MKKTAAIIARVSTGVQDYQRQVDDLTSLAKQMGYQVPDKFIYSEKVSGFKNSDERTALNQIIDEIKTTGKIDLVFAESASRIARKPSVGHGFVETLTEFGIPVFISNMNCASIERGVRNKAFFIQYAMLLEFARIDAEDIQSKFKSGKLNSIKEGRVIGGERLNYGYDRGIKTDRKAAKYVLNKQEATVVKKIFQMYINGSGCKVISNYLNENNIPTKLGKKWSMSSVYQVLKNPFYYGARKWKGEIYENTVPAIISKEKFEKAINVGKGRDAVSERNVKYLYLLKNKLYCGYCGGKYVAKFKPKKHSHYMCYYRSSNVTHRTCEACGIGIEMIESLVWDVVKTNLGLFKYIEKHNDVTKQLEKDIINLKLKVSSYQHELESKIAQVKKWNRLFVMEKVDEDELNQEVGKLQTSIENIRYKLKFSQKEIETKNELIRKGNNLQAYKDMVDSIGHDRVKIADVLNNVLEKVIITSSTIGSHCNTYIVTVYMVGGLMPSTVLFDKTTFESWDNPMAFAEVEYDSKGVLQSDIEKLRKNLEMAYTGINSKGEKVKINVPNKVGRIHFTRLNILTGNKPV
jgi:DNA invertase Pin-like site-specific DNA recombinase